MFQYYGLDWIAAVLILSAIYFIGSGQRFGYILGALGSASGIILSIWMGLWGYLAMEIVLVYLYLRGWRRSAK